MRAKECFFLCFFPVEVFYNPDEHPYEIRRTCYLKVSDHLQLPTPFGSLLVGVMLL